MINLKKYIYSLFFLFSLLFLAACGNESSGLPSQGGDGGPVGDSDDGSIVSLMIMPENPSVAAGEELQLSVKATQSDGEVIDIDASEVSWFSSDQSIVTVNKDGVMKGIKAGTAEVTAVYQGQETTVTVTISPPTPIGLQVLPQVTSVASGVVINFVAQGKYSDGSNKNVSQQSTWSSSNESAATVNLGEVTTIAPGDVQISAEWEGFSGSADLTVTNATLSSLNINPANLNLANGTSDKLTATAVFSDGTSVDVSNQTTWSSDAVGIADVDSTGLVTGAGVGSAVITGVYNATTSTANVNVTNATVSSISISPATVSLANGLTQQFTATANFSDGTTQNVTSSVTWSSSAPNVASIDALGLASAAMTGSTVITAEYGAQTSTSNLTVTDATILSLVVEPDSLTIAKGGKAAITVTANYSDGSSQDVTSLTTITSDAPAVASINADNSIQAVGVGSANVTATFNSSESDPIPVTVTDATVSTLTITPDPLSLAKGTQQQLTATAEFSDASSRDVTSEVSWSTVDSALVSVSSSGLAKGEGVTAGTDVTASFGGQSDSLNVVITNATVASLAVTPNPLSLAKGDTEPLTATATLSDSSVQDVTSQVSWASDDPNIVRVNSNDEAEGVEQGSAILTATYSDPVAAVNVVSPNVNVTVGAARADRLRLQVVDNSLNILGLIRLTLTQGDELFRIQSTAYFSDGSQQVLDPNEVIFSSSNNELIDIDANVISLADADVIGSAVITGTYQSLVSENEINADCLTKVTILGLIGLGLACDIDDTQPNPDYVAP
ncbi:MAG: Ig-like domain-containing protein [Vibrio casei]|uniref:Ig-like domain-containing protein n=2 Tax=Vibrio casei TaxID=673372 RepID=UPI003F949BB4